MHNLVGLQRHAFFGEDEAQLVRLVRRLFGMILVRDRLDMAQAIQAGAAWQQMHLLATASGFAAQPMNQPVEMVDRNAMLGRKDHFGPALAKLANMPGWEATFVFRLGYAERDALPSPRRPLNDVIIRNT